MLTALVTGVGQWPDHDPGGSFRPQIVSRRLPDPAIGAFDREFKYITAELPDVAKELGLKRVDRKGLGTQFYMGTYAAGIALKSAGLLGSDQLTNVGLSVALKGCERDKSLDTKIVRHALQNGSYSAADTNLMLVEQLRPSLFLTQITNLLAANLSLLFSTLGTSRTFVGEEQAGCSALENALRLANKKSPEGCLAGAAFNADSDGALSWLASMNLADDYDEPNVWARSAGMLPASAASFLMIQPESVVQTSSCTPLARITMLARSSWEPRGGSYVEELTALVDVLKSHYGEGLQRTAVLSNAQGTPLTKIEREFWQSTANRFAFVLSNAGLMGSALEVDVFSSIATAIRLLNSSVDHWPDLTNALLPPSKSRPARDQIDRVIVTCAGLFDGLSAFAVERVK